MEVRENAEDRKKSAIKSGMFVFKPLKTTLLMNMSMNALFLSPIRKYS